ncbi:MAG: urea carboxylase-associated family protein, partial [Pseudomonadota bacterium]
MPGDLYQAFQNRTIEPTGVRFPGLHAPHPATTHRIEPRCCRMIQLHTGDVVMLNGAESSTTPVLYALDPEGRDDLAALGLSPNDPTAAHQTTQLSAWIAARGGQMPRGCAVPAHPAPLILKAAGPLILWVAAAAPAEDMLNGQAAGLLEIHIQRATTTLRLPEPLGEIREEFTIPRATAHAYRLRKGDVVQIIDVDGQQCSDFMAFRSAPLERGVERMIDGTVTRTLVGGAYPTPGLFDQFFDSDMRPLLSLVQDTVGRHDTFALACTARGYEERGFPGHVNCSDNISDAM